MPTKNNFLASKYIYHHMLLSKEESEKLLPDVGFYVILGKVLSNPFISKQELIQIAENSRIDAVGFALTKDHFDFISVGESKVIAKQNRPIIEIKPFAFMLSSNGDLLENVFGKGSIDFGLSFSYPMLFQQANNVVKTMGNYKEWDIFQEIKIFKRKNTVPAQFIYKNNRLNGSFRIGRNAFVNAKERITKIKGLSFRSQSA